jgi:hypothetical protein
MLGRKKNLYASLENEEVDGENTSTDPIGSETLNQRVEDRHENGPRRPAEKRKEAEDPELKHERSRSKHAGEHRG